jgi:hypothetical protein
VIDSSDVKYHRHADGTQIYSAASKADLVAQVDTLENCKEAVHQWLLYSGLLLNPSESEVIQFTAGRRRERVDDVLSLHAPRWRHTNVNDDQRPILTAIVDEPPLAEHRKY